MIPYVIRQGDYLTKLALAMGFDADAVWNHDRNRELRERRPNRDILQPGDVLNVPSATERTGLQLSAHAVNRFRAQVPRVELRLTLRDAEGRAFAGKAYRVSGAGRAVEGTTDGEGTATFSVPVHAREVSLTMDEEGIDVPILIGDLDPIEEPSGVRKRLAHLGYLAVGDADEDGQMERAIRAFQAAEGLEVTGATDEATRGALVRAHGS